MIETTSQTAIVSPIEKTANHEGFSNSFGRFDLTTREFIISNVLTPRPWINVLANDNYGVVLSQAGSGFSWFENCQLFRLNRWEQDLVSDAYGRYIFVQDLSTPQELWSTTYMPTRVKGSKEEVRHGLGWSSFHRTVNSIETIQTTFVPLELPVDISIVSVTNHSKVEKEIRLGTYLEWHLGSSGENHREFQRLFVSTQVEGDTMFAWKRQGLEEHVRTKKAEGPTAFAKIVGSNSIDWFTDKVQWLGRLGQVGEPAAMLTNIEPMSSGRWDDPIAAGRFQIKIQPGETKEFAVITGATIGLEKARQLISTITLEKAHELLEQTSRHHEEQSSKLDIKATDPIIDLMANAWLPYQATTGRMTARCAYYQQGGAYGYRDQLQDSLMHLDTDPARTLQQIHLHAEAMYADGSVRHWWHPNTPIFAKSKHSDTCLWLAHATLDYLDETADFTALGATLAYASDDGTGEAGTLLEHCLKGINRVLSHRSNRGLPLIGAGDWNDGLSHAGIDGKGESVWLAMFLFHILNRMAKVLNSIGNTALADRLQLEAKSVQEAVETHGWDGEWYIAGTDDEGRPFGSKSCEQGQIFLNPQTWAVITGIASPERQKIAMESVKQRLIKPYGALLLAPAYSDVDPYIGYITRYAPGLRENGGVYSHAATWAIQALAMNGETDEAYKLWRGMCPPVRSAENAELYAAEPYVMPGNTDGPDSPFESRAGWTWYTGSAAWMRRTLVHWILGVRPSIEGIVIKPNLPKAIPSFTMKRPFRGQTLEIKESRKESS